MTQIVFQVATIVCCIYTTYRLGLFIYKWLKKSSKMGNSVQNTSPKHSEKVKPSSEPDCISPPAIEEYVNMLSKEYPENLPYRITYLVNYPVGNRIQVYINRDSYTFIKRFLAIVSPDTSMSGFISKIIDEHLRKYENEMSELYTECVTKTL